MNLKGTCCPQQDGLVHGMQGGVAIAVDVRWLVDTGADITTLRDTIGSQFDTTLSIGVQASPTTGGGGIQVVTGLEAEFTAEDSSGRSRQIKASGDFGIKSTDDGDDLLGMQQLDIAGASISWDPRAHKGTITT